MSAEEQLRKEIAERDRRIEELALEVQRQESLLASSKSLRMQAIKERDEAHKTIVDLRGQLDRALADVEDLKSAPEREKDFQRGFNAYLRFERQKKRLLEVVRQAEAEEREITIREAASELRLSHKATALLAEDAGLDVAVALASGGGVEVFRRLGDYHLNTIPKDEETQEEEEK